MLFIMQFLYSNNMLMKYELIEIRINNDKI